MVKIDLHVHTKERSFCGRSTEEEQIRAAIDAGLDAIAFSDHDRLAPHARLQELNEKYAPFRIFGGIEISVNREHILVLGVHEYTLETHRWSYPELHGFIQKHEGYITVESEMGKGTTFFIYLPAIEEKTSKEKKEDKKGRNGAIWGEGFCHGFLSLPICLPSCCSHGKYGETGSYIAARIIVCVLQIKVVYCI